MAKGPVENGQQVSAALRAAGGHAPPGPEVKAMPHRDPAVCHPEVNYNHEAFPPPAVAYPSGASRTYDCCPRADASHVAVQNPRGSPCIRLQGVAHTSRDASDNGLLWSYAQLRRDLLVGVGRMDDEVVRLRH